MGDLGLRIRRELARYLTRELSLREFRDWFLPSVWNIDAVVDAETAALAHMIELLLAEFEQGHWLETEVWDRLASQLTRSDITLGQPDLLVESSSSSQTHWATIQIDLDAWAPGFADIRCEEASA